MGQNSTQNLECLIRNSQILKKLHSSVTPNPDFYVKASIPSECISVDLGIYYEGQF